MPQRLRRLGTASAAVSAGALVVLLAAPATEAAAQTCKKGTDPASTIENWRCNLGNLRKQLEPKPTPTPTPTPKPTKSEKPASHKAAAPKKTPKARTHASGGGTAPSARVTGTAPSAMTGGEGLKPYEEKAPAPSSGVQGVLPTPEIAADPNAYRGASGTNGMPQTRLISAVAASRHDDDQMLWVAAAAGAAGAVAALNISVAGRSLRRAAARRR